MNKQHFIHKYAKYQHKYNNLKRQIGGSYDVYLPSELTHYTKHLYYHKKESIDETLVLISDILHAQNGSGHEYKQDACVQLLNKNVKINKKHYINLINSELREISDYQNYLPGGYNFDNMYVQFAPDFNSKVLKALEDSKINKGTIIPREGIEEIILREQSKGGNFIAAPEIVAPDGSTTHTIFYVDGPVEMIKQLKSLGYEDESSATYSTANKKLVKLECDFKSSNSFRHIDEIMCFMPYGTNQFKIWFYDEFKIDNPTIRYCKNYHKISDNEALVGSTIIEPLNEERIRNLNKICMALLGSKYEDNEAYKEIFYFMPFDVTQPSSFNNIWIEKEDGKSYMIISSNSPLGIAYGRGEPTEISLLKSFKTNNPPTIISIEVKDANPHKPEGGVHCMFKQQFTSDLFPTDGSIPIEERPKPKAWVPRPWVPRHLRGKEPELSAKSVMVTEPSAKSVMAQESVSDSKSKSSASASVDADALAAADPISLKLAYY